MPQADKRAITIGNFDGVHLGHRALLARARELVGPDGEVTAMAFHPHPFTRLRPELAPPEIEPWETRVRRLREGGMGGAGGADRVERLEPTPDLLGMSPPAFVGWLFETHRPTHLVEGPDFHFGKGRAGSVVTLRELAAARGGHLEVVPPMVVSLRDQSEVVASSTLVRWLLGHGRVRDAAFVLGRPHELTGTVVSGDRLGRTIGFPTANLSIPPSCLCPGDGVYAGIGVLPDGSETIAAIHVGGRPAIDRAEHRVEAYLMNGDGSRWTPPHPPTPLTPPPPAPPAPRLSAHLPEYGWSCTLRLVGRVRDIVRVNGLDALVGQITRDCARCVEIVGPLMNAGTKHQADAVASEPR